VINVEKTTEEASIENLEMKSMSKILVTGAAGL